MPEKQNTKQETALNVPIPTPLYRAVKEHTKRHGLLLKYAVAVAIAAYLGVDVFAAKPTKRIRNGN